ncbi:ferrochelatase [Prauserella marina]|uniref:Coproporphyrin III ferrochelatase n=1 Tax=Prauserella marina TaxID=530584 RepID=A0A222VRB1_9PSEU|nr:ferrochelatase [Prauserella marina]ASR36434.1 ferrochelatase [Prauserella marina]PWV77246.1 ferrochelatase [Prauserella marina]SDD07737.1 ferrochelatase [Prauserella marina]
MNYDALLWLSFGGPEGPGEVMPFLENVTRGRGVPPARLAEVAEHYQHFGGVSPINQLNKTAIAAVEKELAGAGMDLPVYFGNRNWHPMVEDTLARMAADGVRRALVFPTSAYGGYSACRQYDEDIERARAAFGPGAPELVKLRQFFDHPLFIAAVADGVRAAHAELAARHDPATIRTVFTAHSIPDSADAASGPPGSGGHRYSEQVAEAARLAAAEAGVGNHDVVWQSRSGPPQVPWLEPDIVDHIDALHAKGTGAVVVCPIGFVSDHLEVVWDLDNEAAQRAGELGMGFARSATPNGDPRFAELVVELVREHTAAAPVRKLSHFPSAGCTVNGAPCAVGCCEPVRRPSAG